MKNSSCWYIGYFGNGVKEKKGANSDGAVSNGSAVHCYKRYWIRTRIEENSMSSVVHKVNLKCP